MDMRAPVFFISLLLYLAFGSLPMWGQHEVRGHVTDIATGKGFAGVSVSSPGLRVSAMTDDDGRFIISLPSLMTTLEITAPGYDRQLVAVRGQSDLEINISRRSYYNYYDDAIELHTSATSSGRVTSGVSTLSDALSPQLQGHVQIVRRSGEAASSATTYIRGINSLTMSAQPLYVVDGVVWQMQEDWESAVDGYNNNPLTLIAPSDVESVTVMKNGSALWGAKGANGVVLITTKRGREQATRIEANISMGVQSVPSTIPVMEADAYRRYATELMGTMSQSGMSNYLFTEDDASKSYYKANHNRTRWMQHVMHPSFLQSYGISVSGGDNIALYRFSLGYAQDNGNIKGSRFNRLNVRFNSDINFTSHLSLMADIAYGQTSRRVPFDGLDIVHSPFLIALQKSPLYHPYQYNLDGSLNARLCDVDELGIGNPLKLTGSNLPSVDKYRFNLNLRPTLKFNDYWSLTGLFGFSWDKANEDMFLCDMGLAEEPLVNEQGEVYGIGRNQVRDFMSRQSALSLDAHLDYYPLRGWRHDLLMMFGGRFYQTSNHHNRGVGYNTGSDYIRVLGSTNSDLRFLDAFEFRDRNAAWYLQADYNYMHRFFVSAKLSLESNNRFGSKTHGLRIGHVAWMLSPGIDMGWLISNERWMRGSGINHMQLRLGYTRAGNDRLPLFATRNYFKSSVLARDAQGLTLAHVGNPELKWETTDRMDLGIDLSALHNRLSLHADYYHNVTSDLVVEKSLENVAGIGTFWTNDGRLLNEGFEFGLRTRLVEYREWKLELGMQVAHNINRIMSLNNGPFLTNYGDAQIITQKGGPVGQFYGFRTRGIYSTAVEAASEGLSIQDQSGRFIPFKAGDVRFVDLNGDAVINDSDRMLLGNPNPDFFGNFSLLFSYSRLALEAIFTYSYGAEAYNALRATLESGSSLTNQSTALLQRWTGGGQQTSIPRVYFGDPMGNARFSDRWIEDASYLRLQRLQLSYNVPLRRRFLQDLHIWAAINNVFTVSPYLGSCPEFSFSPHGLVQGIDFGLVPQSRSYTLGIRFNL